MPDMGVTMLLLLLQEVQGSCISPLLLVAPKTPSPKHHPNPCNLPCSPG